MYDCLDNFLIRLLSVSTVTLHDFLFNTRIELVYRFITLLVDFTQLEAVDPEILHRNNVGLKFIP